jgi:hypothetical protein
VTTDTFPTLAEYRHPDAAARARELRSDERYVAIMGYVDQLLADVEDLEPTMRVRVLHDLIVGLAPRMSLARGQAIHELMYDHPYEEVAAMCGLSRQRIYEIHHDWMARTSTAPWPTTGRWSRIVARRQREQAS